MSLAEQPRRGDLTSRYAGAVATLIDRCAREEAGAVRAAARIVAAAMDAEGIAFVFGSGHSHVLGEEAFYRAGGLARVCPVLVPPYMLHEGAARSTRLERESGHAEEILSGYRLDGERDCMIVASNSGVNAVPLEVARAAADRGLKVIAITSVAYGRSVRKAEARLEDVADVVVDNHCPPGDALIALGDGRAPMGPGSTIVGAFLLNSILLGAAEELLLDGREPAVYLSANMPGAAAHNEALAEALRERIPHL